MLRNAIKFCSSNTRHLFLNIACLASILAKSTGSRDFEGVFAKCKLTQISDHALGSTVTKQISLAHYLQCHTEGIDVGALLTATTPHQGAVDPLPADCKVHTHGKDMS